MALSESLPHEPDRGCDFYGTCFTCPLPVCRYDDEEGMWFPRRRREFLAFSVQELSDRRESAPAIAQAIRCEERTVFRLRQLATSAPFSPEEAEAWRQYLGLEEAA